jgi:WD40 repeat protein
MLLFGCGAPAAAPQPTPVPPTAAPTTVPPTAAPTPTPLPSVLKIGAGKVISFSFSRDGSLIASGHEDHTIRLWNIAQAQEKTVLKKHEGQIYSVAFTSDSNRLISLGNVEKDGYIATLLAWNIETQESTELKPAKGFRTTMALSPDGQTIATDYCGGEGGQVSFSNSGIICSPTGVELINISTGETILTTPTNMKARAWSIAFSPNGNQLVYGSADGSLRVFDKETGKEQALAELAQQIIDVAYSPDGNSIAAGIGDNTVRLWDTETGKEITVFKGHTAPVTAVAFSLDGSLLASASVDKTVRLWDVKTGAERDIFKDHTDIVIDLAFSPDSGQLASGSHDGTIRFWSVEQSKQ